MTHGRTNISVPSIYVKPDRLYLYQEGNNIANFSKNASYGTHTATFNEDNIYLYGYYSGSSDWNGCGITSAQSYALTPYTNICFELENTVITGNSALTFGITLEKGPNNDGLFYQQTVIAKTIIRTSTNGVVKMPREHSTGSEGYVQAEAHGASGKAEAYIKNIWLE